MAMPTADSDQAIRSRVGLPRNCQSGPPNEPRDGNPSHDRHPQTRELGCFFASPNRGFGNRSAHPGMLVRHRAREKGVSGGAAQPHCFQRWRVVSAHAGLSGNLRICFVPSSDREARQSA